MNGIQTLWGREPAMVLAFVGACLTLAVTFGLQVTQPQVGAILAVVQLALGLLTRSQVTPTSALPSPALTTTPTPLPTGSESG